MILLVTGITGHSGGYFLDELVVNKYDGLIRCVVRKDSDTTKIDQSGLKIEKWIGDLNDQEFMNKVTCNVNTIMHIGTIFYSEKLIKAAVKNKVSRTILVHTTGIYSKYKSASEEYKKIENAIHKVICDSNSQMGLVFLRPTMIYGRVSDANMIVFIKMVDALRLFPVIDKGRSLLQPVNARDLGRAYYQILDHDEIMHGDYILSGKNKVTMLEMFKGISDILGKKTIFIGVPLWIGVLLARLLKLCSFGKVDHVEKVQRMGEDRSFSHEKAKTDFGYDPMNFTEGLEIEINEYLQWKHTI